MKINRRETLAGISALSMTQLIACNPSERPGSAKDLIHLDGIAQAELIQSGHMSAREAVEAALTRIENLNPKLNAFTDINAEQALDRADNIDALSAFAGLPYALKDLNEYPGLKLERGTAMFKDNMGKGVSPYTHKIDEAGLIVLGKTATPEFGLLGTTEPLAYVPCKNPWNLDHSTGGSSGGAGAAVAARIMPIAQASDGGGSIRNPAAQCGLVGLKPTRGRFPDQGNPKRDIEISIKHAVSLSVRDNAMMLALTEAQNGPLPPVGFVSGPSTAHKRIAMTINDVLGRPPHPDVEKAVMKTAKLLEDQGHEIIPVDLGPGLDPTVFDDFIILWGESVVPIVKAVEAQTGRPVRETGLLEGWTMDLSDRYEALDPATIAPAMQRLKNAGEQINAWLSGFDAWLTPSTAMPAPTLGWTRGDLAFDQNLERSAQMVAHLSMHNVAGTPGISVPAGFSDGLPVGIQLSAKRGDEKTLLELAYGLEIAMPWMGKLPPVHA